MNEQQKNRAPESVSEARRVASELNNLIQIISGTSELIENIWEGTEGSDKYFAMLRASILRAEQVTAQLVAQGDSSPRASENRRTSHTGTNPAATTLHPRRR